MEEIGFDQKYLRILSTRIMTESTIRILAMMMERKSDTDPRSMYKK
jgi:hypothetical protein